MMSAWKCSASGLGCVAAALSITLLSGPAKAQDFYAGKQLNMLVGSAPGGGYDAYARLFARHLPRHIPGQPVIVVQNMPAAGSLAAMNQLANSSPRDGLTKSTRWASRRRPNPS